jgi:hypothetical protein
VVQGALPAGDPGDVDDDGNDDNNSPRIPNRPRSTPPRLPVERNNVGSSPRYPSSGSNSLKEPHFDLKLKYDNVPKWDGNMDTTIRWTCFPEKRRCGDTIEESKKR